MGYRLSEQKSLGYSPYFMLFGREPIFQSRIQDEEERVFYETQGVEAMKVFLDRRGQIFQEVLPLAFRNLAIAQQRDVERYKLVRRGGWDRPKAKFKVGDFFLLKRPKASSLEVNTRPHITRIVELRESRMAVFGGRDRTMINEQVKQIAHYTVPLGDKRVYVERYDRGETSHCRVFGLRSYPKRMVLCDKCNQGYHTWCLTPPLGGVSEGSWTCPRY